MSGKIYEYAVLLHHEEDENGKTAPSEIIVDVKRVVATSEQSVAMLAARDIPPEFADRLDHVEIAIRPF